MSIRLTQPVQIAGASVPVNGATLTLPAALEADLVQQNKAVFVTAPALSNSVLDGSREGSVIELGLSLVDQGYSPQWTTGGGVVNQILNTNVLQHALRRLKMPNAIYFSAGKAGDSVPGALSRWMTDIASRVPLPGMVSYLNGGNDINAVSVAADIETVLGSMKQNFEATVTLIYAMGVRFLLQSLPENGTWSSRRNETTGSFGSAYYRLHAYWRWNRYLMEFARRKNCLFANIAAAYSRPDRQVPVAATSITVAANVATVVTPSAHGYTTGDVVFNVTAGDPTWLLTTGAIITVTNSTTFTYPFTHANGSAGIAGAFVRCNMLAGLWSDAPSNVHFNPAGALKGSHFTYDAMKNGVKDLLCFSEADAENLIGVGVASTTGQDVMNRGLMMGTGGTKTGTAVAHTGNVATGWNSDVVSGNPTAVTLSQVARTAAGQTHMQDQQIVLQASGSNCEYRFRLAHALPTDWAASTAKSLGNWVSPLVDTGLFYVCVVPGTTGASEPVWPVTPGDVVTDGGAKWECRRGWINNGAEQYRLGAEYTIVALSQADALLSMSFGLFDESVSNNSILDGSHVQNADAPGYVVGENGFFSTPAAGIPAGMTAPTAALKIFVKANTTVTLKIGRASWYRSSLNI